MLVFFPLWVFFFVGGWGGRLEEFKITWNITLLSVSELLMYMGIRKSGIILVDDLVYFINS